MKKTFFTLFFLLLLISSINAHAQDSYVVNTPNLNVRTEPNSKAEIIGKLFFGDVVSVINSDNFEWWKISYYGTEGYVAAKFLITLEESEKYKDWSKESASTGDKPECENIIPQYDNSLDNELLVHVGNNTDVVVKLMTYYGNCIRIVYIKAGDSYSIKNIPEGQYYLKIAYGSDFRKFTQDGQCIVKFMRDPSYEKGVETLDFYKIRKPNTVEGDYEYKNWEIPSFELSLNVVYTKNSFKSFHSNKISETEFNK